MARKFFDEEIEDERRRNVEHDIGQVVPHGIEVPQLILQDEHGHQDREQDLHQVLEEGRQVADGHLTAVDPRSAEPHDGNRREIQDRGHDRDRHCEQPVDADRSFEEVPTGVVEAAFLVTRSHERADDPDPGQRLAHDLVDTIELGLHRSKEGDCPVHDDSDEYDHDWQDDDQKS